MTATRIASSLAAGAALLAIVPLTAQAATPLKAWAEGSLKPGGHIDVYATCDTMSGTVTGPAGMSAALSPMADRGYLGADITVPASFKASSATFQVRCADGRSATVVVKAAAASGKLAEDGVLGPKTITALQRYLHVATTGKLDKTTVKALQARMGKDAYGASNKVKVDGIVGKQTVRAVQDAIGCDRTGASHLDRRTVLALQATLNRVNGF